MNAIMYLSCTIINTPTEGNVESQGNIFEIYSVLKSKFPKQNISKFPVKYKFAEIIFDIC